jgi:sigma-E factor negative regulatory protein RseA
MQENLSALVDGELDDVETAKLLAALKQSEALQQEWHTYHLIGDVLRGEAVGAGG